MKKIGLLSDTHSCCDSVFAKHFAVCDEIWHAGDIGSVEVLRLLESVVPVVRAVRGNIDHGEVARLCPEMLEFQVEDVKVLMTHIGGYPGRYAAGMAGMLRRKGIDLMVDGHSHILRVMHDAELDVLHINPGAAGYAGWQKVRTLVRFVIDGGNIRDLEVIELAPSRGVCGGNMLC